MWTQTLERAGGMPTVAFQHPIPTCPGMKLLYPSLLGYTWDMPAAADGLSARSAAVHMPHALWISTGCQMGSSWNKMLFPSPSSSFWDGLGCARADNVGLQVVLLAPLQARWEGHLGGPVLQASGHLFRPQCSADHGKVTPERVLEVKSQL